MSKGNWSTAWNYVHAPYVQDGKQVNFRWNIHFKLEAVPTGDATLTLAFASARRVQLAVYVNDGAKPVTIVSPTDQGGNALLREGIHAKYGVSYAKIPSGSLRPGANTISLVQVHAAYEGNHVMYDYLNLELP
ncbi:MAG: polysaccharide lyase family protein [Chthoniobacteraceae bacterium]